jgi:phosphocarrier protein
VEERQIEVINLLGLHARAAARFVRTASRFQSNITITKEGTTIDGKSILGILFLAASAGSQITISATGDDESEAVEALTSLVAGGFGEETLA